MKLRLLTVSHKQPAWVDAGFMDYARRLPREWRFQLLQVKPEARTASTSMERVQAGEAKRLRAALRPGMRVVALDERGTAWSTRHLAEQIGRWQQEGRDVAFVIGGADGLDAELLAAADQRVALSAMTLPHGIVRVMVAEQLYRAASLLSGHPYHK